MKSNFYHKRVIVTNSARDCIMLCMSVALILNSLDIPFVSKPLFFFFTFMALHIAFVQIRHKLHKNKRVKMKNTIQA
jgi:hypothetical protein